MHYHYEVYVKELPEDIEEYIDNVIDDGDWWQIGGRMTGSHDVNYNPEKDSRNWEICRICEGTGMRNDAIGIEARIKDPNYTCNGCGCDFETTGTRGVRVKWPTDWAKFDGDICKLSDVSNSQLGAYELIVDGKRYPMETWNEKTGFSKTEFDGYVMKWLEKLGISDGYLITVDVHQ